MMEAWTRSMGMDDDQTRALKGHTKDCFNTRHEMARTSRVLFGYLTYAMYQFATWEEMLEDQGFQHLRLRWSIFSVRKEDEGQVLATALLVARKTADRIALAWEEEADRKLTSYCEGKPELCQDVRRLVTHGGNETCAGTPAP